MLQLVLGHEIPEAHGAGMVFDPRVGPYVLVGLVRGEHFADGVPDRFALVVGRPDDVVLRQLVRQLARALHRQGDQGPQGFRLVSWNGMFRWSLRSCSTV